MSNSTDNFAAALGGAAMFLGGVFVTIILGPLIGGVAAWTIGLVFGDTILGIAGQIGIKGVTMWQLGVFLGFVGALLKTRTSVKSE